MEGRLHRLKEPYTSTDRWIALEKEREEWKSKHQAMKDQLNSLEEECRKLQVAAVSTLPPQQASSSSTSPITTKHSVASSFVHPSHHRSKPVTLSKLYVPVTSTNMGDQFTEHLAAGRSSPCSDISSTYSTQSAQHGISTRTVLSEPIPHLTSTPHKSLHVQNTQYENAFSGRLNGVSSSLKPCTSLNYSAIPQPSDPKFTYQPNHPLRPETLTGSLHSSAHSISSLSSGGMVKPHSALSVSRHLPHKPTHKVSPRNANSPLSTSSLLDNDQALSVQLERSQTKIRQLQKEITLLEQQLSDKTLSAKHHVEELTSIRAELAQERSSLAILKQEIKDNAAAEIEQTQRVHRKQCQEFQSQLDRLTEDKRNMERELDNARSSLKDSQVESSALLERLTSLHLQMDQERKSMNESVQLLRAEVKSGCERVTQLEHALEMCGRELDGHVTAVEKNTHQYELRIDKLQNQMESLSSELAQAQNELIQRTDQAAVFQNELSEAHVYQSKIERSLKQSQALYQSLCKTFEEVKFSYEKSQQEIQRMSEDETRLRSELKQQHVRSTELEHNLKQSELLRLEDAEKKKEAEIRVERLEEELQRVKTSVDKYREDINSVEAKTKQREDEVESMVNHMQQEMAKRAQQVLEMDGLLRNHQADTAARRLQLERTLAQRQAEVRARTHELEDAMLRLEQSTAREGNLREEIAMLKLSKERIVGDNDKDTSSKNLELIAVKQKLRDLECVSSAQQKELADLKSELDMSRKREKDSFRQVKDLEQRVLELSNENQQLRAQHINQVKHLQNIPTSLLTSYKQQASAHHLQITQMVEQEQRRQEELSRCRAQVAALSAELSAERTVSEQARRQVAVSRAECIKLEAQVADLEKVRNNICINQTESSSEELPVENTCTPQHTTGNSPPLHLKQI